MTYPGLERMWRDAEPKALRKVEDAFLLILLVMIGEPFKGNSHHPRFSSARDLFRTALEEGSHGNVRGRAGGSPQPAGHCALP
jgi:hypothetical protein